MQMNEKELLAIINEEIENVVKALNEVDREAIAAVRAGLRQDDSPTQAAQAGTPGQAAAAAAPGQAANPAGPQAAAPTPAPAVARPAAAPTQGVKAAAAEAQKVKNQRELFDFNLNAIYQVIMPNIQKIMDSAAIDKEGKPLPPGKIDNTKLNALRSSMQKLTLAYNDLMKIRGAIGGPVATPEQIAAAGGGATVVQGQEKAVGDLASIQQKQAVSREKAGQSALDKLRATRQKYIGNREVPLRENPKSKKKLVVKLNK